MSTKKDLVEAHAFSRRRLVTAFVSGAPGGREVEPSRPGRTIVGGVALGVLVLAGGAIAGIFSGRPPDGWLEPGIVIEKETGNSYVITEESDDPVLRPVVGNINARLIFGTEQEPSTVSAEDIAEQSIGDDIGILGAPAILPSTEQLIDTGWVACTADGFGTRMAVSETPPAVAAPDAGLVVRTGGGADPEYWLIASASPPDDPDDQAFRYLMPDNEGDREDILSDLDLPPATEAPRVDDAWVNLWPEGPPLDDASFDVGSGVVPESADWFEGLPGPVRAGDLVVEGDQVYLVAEDAPARLSAFALVVYRALNDGVEPTPVDGVSLQPEPATPEEWPEDGPRAVEDGSTCAILVTRDNQSPTVLVAEDPADTLDPSIEDDEVDAGDAEVTVEPGRGALVVSAGFGQTEGPSPFVVDSKGVRYQIEGADALANLGYGDADPRVVPDSWLLPFGCGVVLSRNAALGQPGQDSQSSCEGE
ncbi:type VII secretion protein EccB [uncultured Nocardioides sp.]|uniref:type VII secretion protein EccB n=1 Tax=uncultured Nocardioides sp. TaxID=198441 RepID=UPI00261E9AF0|nr:type VII secretion protein EccB [uncultured Nocardioides sp.]